MLYVFALPVYHSDKLSVYKIRALSFLINSTTELPNKGASYLTRYSVMVLGYCFLFSVIMIKIGDD